MPKTFILQNNNAENLLKNRKKFHPLNPFFILNEFIYFSESIETFYIFYTFLKFFIEILNNERNVPNFGYVFVIRLHITSKNFPVI